MQMSSGVAAATVNCWPIWISPKVEKKAEREENNGGEINH